jgi:hypothetical protein|tara:strand:+ start:271 stop:693 length:423 start_codon:yes stop_codon:yes gene_type:complete
MKRLLLILLLASHQSYGDSSSLNLNLPSSQQSYASDRIRAGTLDCQNAIGSSTNLEFGVVGFINSGNETVNPYDTDMTMSQTRVGDVGVYAKINIPIGGPKERINCNTLYQLELEKKRMEVMKLKAEINNLRQLQFAKED